MNENLINKLINKASKLGALGYEVIYWMPPQSGTDDQDGILITRKHEFGSASQKQWFE